MGVGLALASLVCACVTVATPEGDASVAVDDVATVDDAAAFIDAPRVFDRGAPEAATMDARPPRRLQPTVSPQVATPLADAAYPDDVWRGSRFGAWDSPDANADLDVAPASSWPPWTVRCREPILFGQRTIGSNPPRRASRGEDGSIWITASELEGVAVAGVSVARSNVVRIDREGAVQRVVPIAGAALDVGAVRGGALLVVEGVGLLRVGSWSVRTEWLDTYLVRLDDDGVVHAAWRLGQRGPDGPAPRFKLAFATTSAGPVLLATGDGSLTLPGMAEATPARTTVAVRFTPDGYLRDARGVGAGELVVSDAWPRALPVGRGLLALVLQDQYPAAQLVTLDEGLAVTARVALPSEPQLTSDGRTFTVEWCAGPVVDGGVVEVPCLRGRNASGAVVWTAAPSATRRRQRFASVREVDGAIVARVVADEGVWECGPFTEVVVGDLRVGPDDHAGWQSSPDPRACRVERIVDGAPFDRRPSWEYRVRCAGTAAPRCGASPRCGAACVDPRGALDHCGACGRRCALPHAVMACEEGVCRMTGCDEGWGDCDGIAGNGCEVDLRARTDHCGRCDANCGARACVSGRCCTGSDCVSPYADSDGTDGELAPTRDRVLEGRIWNFTRVHIPAGVTVTLLGAGELRARGDVVIDGRLRAVGWTGPIANLPPESLDLERSDPVYAADCETSVSCSEEPPPSWEDLPYQSALPPRRVGQCMRYWSQCAVREPYYARVCFSARRDGALSDDARRDLAVTSVFEPGREGEGQFSPPNSYLGGPAGGALRVGSASRVVVRAGASVSANGRAGRVIGTYGSGGVVVLAAPEVAVERGAVVEARSVGAAGRGRVRISVDPTRCDLRGAFDPPLVDGCTPTDGGVHGRTYIGRWPL